MKNFRKFWVWFYVDNRYLIILFFVAMIICLIFGICNKLSYLVGLSLILFFFLLVLLIISNKPLKDFKMITSGMQMSASFYQRQKIPAINGDDNMLELANKLGITHCELCKKSLSEVQIEFIIPLKNKIIAICSECIEKNPQHYLALKNFREEQ